MGNTFAAKGVLDVGDAAGLVIEEPQVVTHKAH